MKTVVRISVAVLLLLGGCGGKDKPTITMDVGDTGTGTETVDGGQDVCTPSCEGKECGPDGCNDDCGTCNFGLEECSDDGLCVAYGCTSTKDCPGELVCAKDIGECVICVGDEDCPEGEKCGADHFCHTEFQCTSDKDCKDHGMVCDKEAGICVQCLTSEDCEPEEYCLEAYCVDDVCTAGESHCDGLDIVKCNDDGSAEEVTETCTDTQYCEDGKCHEQVCLPGQTACVDNLLLTCGPFGSEVIETVDCEDDEKVCYEGACMEQVCEPDSTWCHDDFTAAACLEDGMASTTAPCGAEHYCEEGACKPQVCDPGSVFCDGEVYKVCNDKGSAIQYEEDCAEKNQHCFNGSCIDTECPPNQEFCEDDTTKALCADDGMSSTPEACPAGHYCAEGDATVQCLPWVCTPAQAFCEDNTAKVCNSKGSAIINEIACGDNVCVGGACKPVICDANTSACAGKKVMQCDATGTVEQELEVCGDDQYCEEAGNNAQCKDQVCEPGEKFCDGSKVMLCNGNGSDSSEDKDCADGQQGCKDGECVDQICSPNATYCDGNVVKECNGDGTSSSVVETCGENQYCGEDGNAAACANQVCTPNEKTCQGTKVMECDEVGAELEELKDCTDDGEGCSGGECVEQVCGNGALDPGEECDDGNQLMCDGCEGCASRQMLDLMDASAVACTDANTPSLSTWTVEAWVRFEILQQQGPGHLIAGRLSSYPETADTRVTQVLYIKWTTAGQGSPYGYRFRARYEDAGDWDYILTSESTVEAGKWYHVAYVREPGGFQKLFVNGQLDTSSQSGGTSYVGSGVTCVGDYASNEAVSPRGYLDEYHVSDTVRYASDFIPERRLAADQHTVLLWHFDEGTGGTAYDASGNGHSLTWNEKIGWASDTCYGTSPDAAVCGDGQQAVWEECDDGNTEDGDGCSGECKAENQMCGVIECPVLPGYDTYCNSKGHCEYPNLDQTGWKQWDVWVYAPPGTFQMGSPANEPGHEADEGPVHQVTFQNGFFIGKYEVVVSQYEACVNAGACVAVNSLTSDGKGWGINSSNPADQGPLKHYRPGHPQNGLRWQDAKDFCIWVADGGRLPSEAEMEYAATGPVHQKYPWGNSPEPTCSNDAAVFDEDGDKNRPWGCDPCVENGCSGTSPVGSKPAGMAWSGALDLSGNLWEWCEDWQHDSYVGAPVDGSAWVVPSSIYRVHRGGCFTYGKEELRSAAKYYGPPANKYAGLGARCVRPLP